MELPRLYKEDVQAIIPDASEISEPMNGGQKLIFPCTYQGKRYALKFMLANLVSQFTLGLDDYGGDDEITTRAKREVGILERCESPNIVKLGPIPLTRIEYSGQPIIYFSEEYIEGEDLENMLMDGRRLDSKELIELGLDINEAVRILWSFKKIHRDIKPKNIMRKSSDNRFVLLDMGIAFDQEAESITGTGMIVGTHGFYSPEQTFFQLKRQMDFRSDHFSLGVVMYLCATSRHPFINRRNMSREEVVYNIRNLNPEPPSVFVGDISDSLDKVIMRLLNKRPHLRYRECEQLKDELIKAASELGGD